MTCFGLAPMEVAATSPLLKTYTAGMDVMPYLAAVAGLSSTFSLTTSTLPACSAAMSSRIGVSMRHGPHHSAQKSTMTGLSAFRTSVSKLESVTSLAVLMMCSLSEGGRSDGGGGSSRNGRVAQPGQIVLDVDRGDAAGARGGNGLAVGRVHDVAGGEDAGQRGPGGAALDGDGALGGQFQLALD